MVLGLGMATLVPRNGVVPMTVANVKGVQISGLIFDAGPVSSPVLLEVGSPKGKPKSDPDDPTVLSDVFFRIGGAHVGKATTSLVVNSGNVILDDIWAWRADHGTGVGWTVNTADTGVVVNGDDVTAYGLFVEHYQKTETIWNGNGGTVIFFQNEMPYDPPSQAAWSASPGHPGFPALAVADRGHVVRRLQHGQLQLLQPGSRHLLRERLRSTRHACRRQPPRPADDLP